jgi:hypothetical protein
MVQTLDDYYKETFDLYFLQTEYIPLETVRITLRLAVYRQSARLGDNPLETRDQQFFLSTEPLRLYSSCSILSDERMGMSFTIAASLRHRSHSMIRVPRDSRPYFNVSGLRLSQFNFF